MLSADAASLATRWNLPHGQGRRRSHREEEVTGHAAQPPQSNARILPRPRGPSRESEADGTGCAGGRSLASFAFRHGRKGAPHTEPISRPIGLLEAAIDPGGAGGVDARERPPGRTRSNVNLEVRQFDAGLLLAASRPREPRARDPWWAGIARERGAQGPPAKLRFTMGASQSRDLYSPKVKIWIWLYHSRWSPLRTSKGPLTPHRHLGTMNVNLHNAYVCTQIPAPNPQRQVAPPVPTCASRWPRRRLLVAASCCGGSPPTCVPRYST